MSLSASLFRAAAFSAAVFAVSASGTAYAAGPEKQLSGVLQAIDEQRLDLAMQRVEALIAEHPNFRLAHLIRGDLLLARRQPIQTLGNVPKTVPQDKIDGLRAEALSRLPALRERPNGDLVPRHVLQLDNEQQHALVVDSRRLRLYVFQNDGDRPRLVADYYVSLGKNGIEKSLEGDQKTPVGVCHVTANLPRQKLNDFYGSGAFPINYPNAWDRKRGRAGHGIWLHGTPSDTYSRPPRASDGCIVLSNSDLDLVAGKARVGATPVVIADELEWVPAGTLEAERKSLADALEAWRADWETRDTAKYLSHYSAKFSSANQDLAAWAARKRKVNAGKQRIKVGLNRVSMFHYPRENFVVVGFDQDYRSSNLSNVMRKRQYWVREGARWKIIYEGGA